MHDRPAGVLTGVYPEDEYWQDLLKVTGGETDEHLARLTIRHTDTCRDWMRENGVRFQPSMAGTLQLSRTNAFFLGGGKALVNANYHAAATQGVELAYESEVVALNVRDGRFTSAIVSCNGSQREIQAKAMVAASGGFESNLEWLREAWGAPADNFLIRGTPFNRGRVLRQLIREKGGAALGDPTQGHFVAIDARSPKFDGGIVTSLARRRFHHLTFYGFMLCFAATCVAKLFFHYALGRPAPYPLLSIPVVLGVIGGIGLLLGPVGLLWLRSSRDRALTDEKQAGMDAGFLVLLFLTSATGLALLALLASAAMGMLLAVHLAVVMALFGTMPYGKFVHGIYRYAALVRDALERARPAPKYSSD